MAHLDGCVQFRHACIQETYTRVQVGLALRDIKVRSATGTDVHVIDTYFNGNLSLSHTRMCMCETEERK